MIETSVKPNILATLTILLIYKVMIKMAHAIMKNKGLYTSNTPTLVATALPPLKPAKIGNTCPKIADNPINSTLLTFTWKINGKQAVIVPFNMSINNTTIPAFFPRTLKVLVVW